MNNPWKTKNTKEVYDNNWIKVEHHEVSNAAGKDGIYGTVHFKNLAIGVIPLDEQKNTWLVGQYRYPLGEYSWEIPEGGGKLNVDPIESAKRELKEETGIKAESWTEILRLNTSNSVTDELGIIYLARDLKLGKSNPDEDEQLEIRKLPFDEAFQMVMDGKIKDSLSVAAILKLKFLLEE